MTEARSEYHLDRMQQARYEYDNKKTSAAVAWLVYGITMMGDKDMEDEAANFLIKIPEVDQHIRGWRAKYPEVYADLLTNDIVAQFVEENGV